MSLVFLAEGTTPVRISRTGYKDLELPVEIAATATTGLTLLLERAPQEPPTDVLAAITRENRSSVAY